jgi:GAF domain-containing protein/HAMP domain-containing protein
MWPMPRSSLIRPASNDNQMTTQSPTPNQSPNPQRALRISAILVILHLIFTGTLALVGFQRGILPMQGIAAITLAIAIAGIIALILCRRGRVILGIWILIFAISLGIPIISVFAANYGWIILFSIPLVVGIVANLALPIKSLPQALFVGAFGGVAGILIDLYGAPTRSTMPNSEIIIPIVVITILALGLAVLVRQFSSFTMLAKLLVMFIGVAIIPLSLLIYINNIASQNALTQVASQNLGLVASHTGSEIDEFIQNNLELVQTDAQLDIFRSTFELPTEGLNLLKSGVINTLQLLTSKNPEYIKSYHLLDRNGVSIANYPQKTTAVPDYLGLNPTLVNNLQIALLADLPFISPIIIDEDGQGSSIYFAGGTKTVNDEPLGLLLVRYDAAILQDLIAERNGAAGENSFGVIFDDQHIQLAHGIAPDNQFKSVIPFDSTRLDFLIASQRLPNVDLENLTINLPALETSLRNTKTTPVFTLEANDWLAETSQVAVYRLENRPWKVAFFQSKETFLVAAGTQSRFNLVMGIAITGIVTIAAVWAARLIGAPISNLTELVERISAGDLTIQVPIGAQDEIGRLAAAFNSMTAQIQNLLAGLESQVTDRTLELERRALQIQSAAEIARDASSMDDLDTLLNRAVDLIEGRFGFYHAAIFLIDEPGEFAVLQAASSAGGKQMLTQNHKLKVGEVGIVGDTTATGRPHIALDVGLDVTHFAHPLLPETRSEMALPLKVGETIIGALDVQSQNQGAFDDDDIVVLQVMADQLAIAIRNNQLLAELQYTVEELQAAYGQYTRRSWREWTQRSLVSSGYRYQDAQIQPILKIAPTEDNQSGRLKLPITLRDTALGTIDLSIENQEVSPEMVELVEDIAERLALALDNARLLEATQFRAAQEQRTAEITSKIRETLDVNTVLRSTIQEMRDALGLYDITVHLAAPTDGQALE